MNVRRAEAGDIPAILDLLVQVDMVHHRGRPDLFKGQATKYNAEELRGILADEATPVFVCTDGNGRVLGHGFCILQHSGGQLMEEHDTPAGWEPDGHCMSGFWTMPGKRDATT